MTAPKASTGRRLTQATLGLSAPLLAASAGIGLAGSTSWAWAVGCAGTACGLAGLGLQQARLAGQQARTQRELASQLDKHHKDASRWDWQARQATNRVRTQLTALAGAAGPSARPAVSTNDGDCDPRVARLQAMSLFDPLHYRVESGAIFRRADDAAAHFLRVGMPALQSATPLVDPTLLPQAIQAAWRVGDLDAIAEYLQRAAGRLVRLSRWFDPRELAGHELEWAQHPGGCVGWFAATARPETRMPSVTDPITWADLQAGEQMAAQAVVTSRAFSRPRLADHWDFTAEQAWKEAVRADTPTGVDELLVSIVMPVWNRETLVGAAIDSVLAQTHQRWELIVVDDGSTDGTVQAIRQAAEADPRIRLLQPGHGGVCAARNHGLDAATGNHVAFLDSDNVWEPEFLELMLRGMARADSPLAYSAMELARDNGTLAYRAHQGGHDDLLVLNHIDLNVLVARLELVRAVGGFDTTLRRWVDHDLVLRLTRDQEPVLLPFIGCRYRDTTGAADRITTSESDNWQWVALARSWERWDEAERGLPERQPGRVSVCIPVYGQADLTAIAIQSVLSTTAHLDVEVMLVDNGSDAHSLLRLASLFASEPKVRLERLPRNLNFAIGSNIGAIRSTGEYVLFLNNDTEVQDGWLEPLLERIQRPGVVGVQPLLLFPDNSIQSAGTVFVAPDTLPVPFLCKLPPEDAAGVDELEFDVVTAAAMLMRARDVVALRGFDALFVNGMEDIDLCLRARRDLGGHFVVEPRSVVRHWESKTPGRGKRIAENRALFMQRWRGQLPAPQDDHWAHQGVRVLTMHGDGLPTPAPRTTLGRLPGRPTRWGIRQSAIGGVAGDRWGDTAFVASLADALRAQGQEVVTYRHGANNLSADCLDDVTLVLRGIDRVAPVPGTLSILWVISHPEDVTVAEVQAFDHVFAASAPWAAWMSRKAGREVHVLHQATDARRFHPDEQPGDASRPAVFVGSTHSGRTRPVVENALAAGVDLRVIGTGWHQRLTAPTLEADWVDNADLPDVYRSATVVLADHWEDMARLGFVQNRIFDAVACGVRVVSDRVTGLEELFGDEVQTYRDTRDLARLCKDAAVARAQRDPALRTAAERVLREHSFAARARQLIALLDQESSTPTS